MVPEKECPLYRVLKIFEDKIIIDKNLTIFYITCDQEKDSKYYKHAVAIILWNTFHFIGMNWPINL